MPIKAKGRVRGKRKDATKDTKALASVRGFRASGVSCSIKKSGNKDLALMVSDTPAIASGVFTKSRVKAAPLLVDIKRLRRKSVRGIVVNSGVANAFTGKEGEIAALAMAGAAERAIGAKKGEMLVASTGLIGASLPIGAIEAGMPRAALELRSNGWVDAAEAIMTTDSFAKLVKRRVRAGGKMINILGVAKGAGMVCPNMATMLAFIITDAKVGKGVLDRVLKKAVDKSFNKIIIDNDTSTNDMVLILANGASGAKTLAPGSSGLGGFTRAIEAVCLELAQMIVRDGEGATKFIEVSVKGAATLREASAAARAVAESFLVKTAFFGEDPNWGRIIAALGRSGARLNQEKVSISINGVAILSGGNAAQSRKRAARAMKNKDIRLVMDLKSGKAEDTVWTTDLSTEYVKFNSAYTT